MSSRVASYARVSTDDQTVAQQLDRLRSAAPGALEFVDAAQSGRSHDRPAFVRLRAAIEAGELDEVYAVKLDRLGRSARGVLEFFELAERRRVRIVLVDQQLDTSTPIGRAIRTMLALVAELEADLIAERTRAAMRAFKDGTRTPRGKVGRPVKLTEEIVREISRLRAEGFRWADVAQKVHLPASTCRKVGSRLSLPQPAGPTQVTERIREQISQLRAAGLTWRQVGAVVRLPVRLCKEAAASRTTTNSAINRAADFGAPRAPPEDAVPR